MKIRKADRPAFEEAVSTAMLAVRPQLLALRDVLPRAIYGLDCPDHLFEAVRKEVVNEILRALVEPIMPPLMPGGDTP